MVKGWRLSPTSYTWPSMVVMQLILLPKSETRTIQGQRALVYSVCQSASPREHDFASGINFADGVTALCCGGRDHTLCVGFRLACIAILPEPTLPDGLFVVTFAPCSGHILQYMASSAPPGSPHGGCDHTAKFYTLQCFSHPSAAASPWAG
jgi:hypothetical protein